MTGPRLTGFPGPSDEVIAVQEEITAALTHLHRALQPLLQFLPGPKTSLTIAKKVAGDALTVTLRPGAKE